MRRLLLVGLALTLALGGGCRKATTTTAVPAPAPEVTPAVPPATTPGAPAAPPVATPTPPVVYSPPPLGGTTPVAPVVPTWGAGERPGVNPPGVVLKPSVPEPGDRVLSGSKPPALGRDPEEELAHAHLGPDAPAATAPIGKEPAFPKEPATPKEPSMKSGEPSSPPMPRPPQNPATMKVGGKTLAEWKHVLRSEDPSKRTQAIMAVTAFGDASGEVVPLLIERTSDRDVSPRVKALMALRMVSVHHEDVPKVVKALAARLEMRNRVHTDSQVPVRYEAAMTLQRFVEDAGPAIPALIDGTQDVGSWEIRLACLQTLWRVAAKSKDGPEDRVIQAILTRLSVNETAHQVKIEAVLALGALGRPANPVTLKKVIEALNHAAHSTNFTYGIWGFAGLVALDDHPELALGAIARQLHNSDLEVRATAARALGALGKKSRTKIPRLLEVIRKKDEDTVVVGAACSALAEIGEPNADVVETLTALQESKDLGKAAGAIVALAHLAHGDPKVMATLDRLLERKDKEFEPLRPYIQHALELHKKPKEPAKAGKGR